MKRKILLALAILSCLASLFIAGVQAQTICSNESGSHDGYDYELWKDGGGSACMTLNSGGSYRCQWSNVGNMLGRNGRKFNSTQTHQQIGNISVSYGCNYQPSGNSYLAVYGWTENPLVEYYIVESWGSWRPPGASPKGTIAVDGGTYEIYETTRTNQPSIQGTATFQQYWSVRTSKRTSGTLSVSKHFQKWESLGMNMGEMYEVALAVEGYQSSGNADVYRMSMNIDDSADDGTDGTDDTDTDDAAEVVAAINVGSGWGGTYNGNYYEGDNSYDGGRIGFTFDPIAGAQGSSVYQTERYGTYTYEIPVDNGDYHVELGLVELYWNQAGSRSVSITVEGTSVLNNADIYQQVGHDVAYDPAPVNAVVNDGSLTIQVSALVDNGTLSRILVLTGHTDDPDPEPDPGPDPEPDPGPDPEPDPDPDPGPDPDGDANPSMGCGKTPSITSGNGQMINVSGSNRAFNLAIPDNYDKNHPYRLMVAYHWLGGTANNVSGGNYYGLWDLAEGSTIFVAPQGTNNGWFNSGGSDVEFSRQLITMLEDELCIDKSRVFSEGFSMGGSMSYAMACAMGDDVRAVAVHSGGPMSGCVNPHDKPVAYFMTHGTNDSVCTYPQYGVPQVEDFANVNGCTVQSMPTPTDPSGMTPACVDFSDCDPDNPVRACIFVGGHTWSPGGAASWVPGETWDFLSQF